MNMLRWLGYETHILLSSLPVAECVRRLRAAVAGDGLGASGKSLVLGTVGAHSLRLHKRLSGGSYNSFQTYLSGQLIGEGETTRLTCRSGMHWFILLFMALWLSPFVAITLLLLFLNLRDLSMPDLETYFVPLLFMLLGVGLLGIGRFMARGERQFLLDFLYETIGARAQSAFENPQTEPVVQR